MATAGWSSFPAAPSDSSRAEAACFEHATVMLVANVQVKHVDDETHEALRRRAAEAGMTLGDYVLTLIRRDLRRPARSEWLAHVRSRPPIGVTSDEIVQAVHEARAERGR